MKTLNPLMYLVEDNGSKKYKDNKKRIQRWCSEPSSFQFSEKYWTWNHNFISKLYFIEKITLRYSEKATKNSKCLPIYLTLLYSRYKKGGRFFQMFVAFLEYRISELYIDFGYSRIFVKTCKLEDYRDNNTLLALIGWPHHCERFCQVSSRNYINWLFSVTVLLNVLYVLWSKKSRPWYLNNQV